jgi:Tfp pilus assembly protein PilX
MKPRHTFQHGATLMVGMVMLLMMTLIVVGVIRLTTRHTQVVNNEQFQTEATSAAHYALDMVLTTPASTWDANYTGSTGKTMYVNLGTMGSADKQDSSAVAVTVKNLTCKRQRTIKNGELIKTRTDANGTLKYVPAEDSSCFGGGGSPITIVDTSAVAPGDDSFCANVLYEMEATVSDASVVSAATTVVQGTEVRRGIDDIVNCD